MKRFYTHFSKKIVSAVLVAVMAVGGTMSTAASVIDDAQSAINQANENLNQTNSTISSIESQQATLQTEIDSLDSELVGILLEIDVLNDELAQKEIDIQNTTQALAEAEEEQAKQYENMKLRMRFMYENSNTNIVTALLGATSIADFLNRVEYFNQIYSYDRQQLENYKAVVGQVKEEKAQLETEQNEMEQLKENYEHQSAELQETLDRKRSTMDDFDNKLAYAKELAAKYKETINQQNQIIREEQARLEEVRRQQEEERRRQEEERRRQEQEQQNNNNNNNDNSGSTGDTGSTGSTGNTGSTGSTDDGTKNPSYSTNVSGQDVVDYAMQFIGNPYVWGGTSLTNGCDCSGFTMKIYEHFGVSLPHSSYEQRSCGKSVSLSNAQPGDLVCYSGHVVIYIGNGMIVGAQSSATGITTTRVNYRTILDVRRVL